MVTISNFNKNNSYTDEEIKELVKDVDSWTDENILYLYISSNDFVDRKNILRNIVRIHNYINRERLVTLLNKYADEQNALQAR